MAATSAVLLDTLVTRVLSALSTKPQARPKAVLHRHRHQLLHQIPPLLRQRPPQPVLARKNQAPQKSPLNALVFPAPQSRWDSFLGCWLVLSWPFFPSSASVAATLTMSALDQKAPLGLQPNIQIRIAAVAQQMAPSRAFRIRFLCKMEQEPTFSEGSPPPC